MSEKITINQKRALMELNGSPDFFVVIDGEKRRFNVSEAGSYIVREVLYSIDDNEYKHSVVGKVSRRIVAEASDDFGKILEALVSHCEEELW